MPGSTGALAASAGDPSPVLVSSASRRLWKDSCEAETYACGDLIGVDQFVPFPADAAPFREPSSMEAVRAAGMKPDLPPADLAGGGSRSRRPVGLDLCDPLLVRHRPAGEHRRVARAQPVRGC